jgi:uncharacterized protein YndB with AHSA1/START domain
MEQDTITIETIIHAPVEQVWKAWTEPAFVLNFFGSDLDGWGVKAELDVRPGGKYQVTFANSDGAEHTGNGVYTEVKAFNCLTFTWTWKSEPGVESFVTVVLIPEGDFTRLQFQHANVGTASAHNYLYGWQQSFLKLERMLEV